MADNKLPDETMAAVAFLVKTAKKEGVLLCGFAIVDSDKHVAFFNFGTDAKYTTNVEFYRKACELANKKIREGLAFNHDFGEAS